MQKLLLRIDRLSTWVGQAFSWLIVGLTLLISWEVFSRYALDHPHAWAFDVMIIMYGTMFMMAGAYTLAKNGHVRGDVLYSFFRPRTQASWDLLLYIVFFLPGTIALTYAGYFYASDSFAILERSSVTSDGPPIYQFMAMIAIPVVLFTPWTHLTNGHLGLLMLALIVIAIMLGFPTAFTLMGMGVFFAWLAYRSVDPGKAVAQTLDLFVQRSFGVMSN